MNDSRPELPGHLYIENYDPDSSEVIASLAAHKVLAWSQEGRGDAIDKWCKHVADQKIAAIGAWEESRFLRLEEQWISVENDEDDDAEEERYHQACAEVARKARLKREQTRQQSSEHRSAIEKIVEESREFIEAQEPPPQEDHFFDYVLATAVVITVIYLLNT
ncbi:MAG: hypothetical protein OEY45_10330, partial [Gammaproteobacteria bacterium]|nr:hypothetical protein [Gammaproteobacteria bacterium]